MASIVATAKHLSLNRGNPARRVTINKSSFSNKHSNWLNPIQPKTLQRGARLVPSTSDVITDAEPVALLPFISNLAPYTTEWEQLSEHVGSNLPAVTVAGLEQMTCTLQNARGAHSADVLSSVFAFADLALAIFVAESINKASPANIAKLVTLLSHVRVGNADKTLTSKYESLAEKAVFKLSAACNGKDVALETFVEVYQAQARSTVGITFAGMQSFGRARQETLRHAPASASQCYDLIMASLSFVDQFSCLENVIALVTSQLKDLSLEQMATLASALARKNRRYWSTQIVERFFDAMRCEVLSRFEEGLVGLEEAAAVVHDICEAVGVFSPAMYQEFVQTPGLWMHSEVLIPEPSMYLVR